MNRSTLCGKILASFLLLIATSAIAQASGNAGFVGTDSSTLGNWPSKYGFDGYALPTAQSPLMNISSFSHPNSSSWVWASSTTDTRALQAPGGGPASATTWYNDPSFYFDITTQGIEQVALYAVDWDNRGRSETLQVVDGDTNAQLDVRPISNFTNGVYLVWTISGHVKINVTAMAGPNAVISGVFFGGGIGATIHVPTDQSTIQAAINAASNGDTVLVAPGTYHENINFLGKGIIVTSSGGAAVTTIDGGQLGPVVTFSTNEGRDSVLSGFTIRNGLASTANDNLGGGIYVSGAYPRITGNSIIDNRGCSGVGIGSLYGDPLIQENLIEHNIASTTCSGGYGIGIYIEGTGLQGSGPILDNTITGNSTSSGEGGGIAIYGAAPLIQGNFISDNSVSGISPAAVGGGIYVFFVTHTQIVNNVIVRNTADSGGGIGVFNADDSYSNPVILNNTVVGNVARQSTGSGMLLGGFAYYVTLSNNVVVAPSGQQAITCDSTFSSSSPFFSYNDVYSGGQLAWSGVCDFTTNPGNIFVDPLLVNPNASNFHLQPGSPVINVGNNAAGTFIFPTLPSTDFEGNPRIVGGTVDLGAFEYQGLTTASVSPTSPSFPNQLLNSSSQPLSITLTNTGGTALQISGISTTGNFSETDNCQTSTGLPAGKSCQLNIQFTPSVTGLQSGQLNIVGNVSGTTVTVPLSGTGISSSSSSAALIGTDTATVGHWQSNYGHDGFSIANGSQTLPTYDPSFAPENQSNWTWVASSTDPRALKMPAGGSGLAATWYNSSSFSFDVNFIDGNVHQLALYALDWDLQGRSETIQVFDAVSKLSLASTTISNFSNGVYVVWNISGHVKIYVTTISGPNAVISGVFFGGASSSAPPSPSLNITKTHVVPVQQGQQGLHYTVIVANASGAGPTNGAVTVTENIPAGLTLVSMLGNGWNCTPGTNMCTRSDVLSGGNAYTPITVTANVAANATSPQVNQVTVSGGGSPNASASDSTVINAANSSSTATFVTQDAKTQGSWQGVFGSDGYSLPNSAQNLPPYDPGFTVQNQSNWTWAATTTDPRAAQVPALPSGIASAWYSAQSFFFDVNLNDGQQHYIALYALDWDKQGRSESIQILDGASSAQLDQENISNFANGVYLVWRISGHVKIVVTSTAGPNAVISGVFFGVGKVTYSFSGSNTAPGEDGLAVAFKYVPTSFVSTQLLLLGSQLSSCTNCLNDTIVPAVQFQPATNGADQISFADVNDNGTIFSFPLGAFTTPGTYTSFAPYNPGTLTVNVGTP